MMEMVAEKRCDCCFPRKIQKVYENVFNDWKNQSDMKIIKSSKIPYSFEVRNWFS